MTRIGFLIVCLVFSLMAMSCRQQRQLIQSSSSDSVQIEVRDVEKTVHLPADSVSVSFTPAFDTPAFGTPAFDTPNGYSGGGTQSQQLVKGQSQTIETARTKVTVELTSNGQIKATAVSKPVDATVTVQEKTITRTSQKTEVVAVKESALKRSLNGVKKTFNTVLYTVVIILGLYAFFRFRSGLKSFVNNLLKIK